MNPKLKSQSINLFMVLGLALSLSACNSKSSDSSGASSPTPAGGASTTSAQIQVEEEKCRSLDNYGVSYHYIVSLQNNAEFCTTGCRSFQSLPGLCAGLMSESLNNQCAHDRRMDLFRAYCQ